MHLGKSVPEAFSWKIQRRLASTVPPRPMVHVSAADATAHMTRFCQDAVDVQQILEYRGPYNLQVCLSFILITYLLEKKIKIKKIKNHILLSPAIFRDKVICIAF